MDIENSFYNTRREYIYKYLKKLILENEISEGTVLTETSLAKKFGVSTTPVREAIRMLDHEGLIKNVPYKGNVVNSITREEKKEIYNFRGILEAYVGQLAAQKIKKSEIESLRALLEKAKKYISKQEYEKVKKINNEFHRKIWKACRNKVLIKIINNVEDYIEQMREEAFNISGQPEISLKEHEAILESLEKSDPNLTQQKIKEHIFRITDEV